MSFGVAATLYLFLSLASIDKEFNVQGQSAGCPTSSPPSGQYTCTYAKSCNVTYLQNVNVPTTQTYYMMICAEGWFQRCRKTRTVYVIRQQQSIRTVYATERRCCPGYYRTGTSCERNCTGLCQNGGVCFNLQTGSKCQCSTGYIGNYCETRNYCSSNPCKNQGTCRNIINGFSCQCTSNFTGKQCETNNYCSSGPCLNNGNCVNNQSNFTCLCPSNFTGWKCESKLHCSSHPCLNNGYCLNTLNKYNCNCIANFTGKQCESRNYCFQHQCRNGGRCINLPPKYTCQCHSNYTGGNCEIVDYCRMHNDPCKHQGKCQNNMSGYTCICTANYTGMHCETNNYCLSNPCMNSKRCIINTDTSYSCVCLPKYTGRNCETKYYCGHNKCLNKGVCQNTNSSFVCQCPGTFTGRLCEIPLFNCQTFQCKNGGKCLMNNDGSLPRCLCQSDYTGSHCESLVDPCNSSPCKHNGRCSVQPSSSDNQYKCTCISLFIGRHCQSYKGNAAVRIILKIKTTKSLITDKFKMILADIHNKYCTLYNCGLTSEAYSNCTKDEIIYKSGFPKELNPTTTEIQFVVLSFPNKGGKGSAILDPNISQKAVKHFREYISSNSDARVIDISVVNMNSQRSQNKDVELSANVGQTIGIIVGVIITIFMLVSLAYRGYRTWKSHRTSKKPDQNKQDLFDVAFRSGSSKENTPTAIKEVPYVNIRAVSDPIYENSPIMKSKTLPSSITKESRQRDDNKQENTAHGMCNPLSEYQNQSVLANDDGGGLYEGLTNLEHTEYQSLGDTSKQETLNDENPQIYQNLDSSPRRYQNMSQDGMAHSNDATYEVYIHDGNNSLYDTI